MLLRLLLLAALVWLAWRVFSLVRARLAAPPPVARVGEPYEPMQRCAGCGTYLPARSLSADGRCGRCLGKP